MMNALDRAELGNLINEMQIKSDMAYAKLIEKALAVNEEFDADAQLSSIAIRRNFTPEGLATLFVLQDGIDFDFESDTTAVLDLVEAYGEYKECMGKVEMLKCLRDDYVWIKA